METSLYFVRSDRVSNHPAFGGTVPLFTCLVPVEKFSKLAGLSHGSEYICVVDYPHNVEHDFCCVKYWLELWLWPRSGGHCAVSQCKGAFFNPLIYYRCTFSHNLYTTTLKNLHILFHFCKIVYIHVKNNLMFFSMKKCCRASRKVSTSIHFRYSHRGSIQSWLLSNTACVWIYSFELWYLALDYVYLFH